MTPITGSIVALTTPMHTDGSVDYPTLRKLIDWHIAEGTDCIGVVGTTGESPTLDMDEHSAVIRFAVQKAKGRCTVIAGTGGLANLDLSKPFYGPSEDAIDLWASYERKITKKIYWKIQLNVRNAFAKDKLIPISVQPDGKTWASARIAPNQEWFVTNTFSF